MNSSRWRGSSGSIEAITVNPFPYDGIAFTCGNTSWMPWYSVAMSGPKMCCAITPPGPSRDFVSS
ncbi:hypothetical protein [Archangium sp.]|uniref:hypothetical protein n=1 Tax=Archangium sp. TaxID=1872627 RepID=UPI002D71B670|nr:hypothetical protein [Archangium sp.]HYO58189.1 hypothetical protein [Archangium sp.]